MLHIVLYSDVEKFILDQVVGVRMSLYDKHVEALPTQADSNSPVTAQIPGTRKVQTSEVLPEKAHRQVPRIQKVQSTAKEFQGGFETSFNEHCGSADGGCSRRDATTRSDGPESAGAGT